MSQHILLNGFELRRGIGGRDITVYHCQTVKDWRVMTFISKLPPNTEGVGDLLLCEDENDITDRMKPFRPWRTRSHGRGKVRGYTVTYDPQVGVEAWVYVQLKTDSGPRNIPCLVAESRLQMESEDDFRQWWQDLLCCMMEDHPLTATRAISPDPKTGLYRLEDFGGYDLTVTYEPALGSPSSAELPPSPAR